MIKSNYPRQRYCEKVMFSDVCVGLSSCDHCLVLFKLVHLGTPDPSPIPSVPLPHHTATPPSPSPSPEPLDKLVHLDFTMQGPPPTVFKLIHYEA